MSEALLLLIGPAGAAALYWQLYRHYRNTHQSHALERETLVNAQPVRGSDRKVNEIKGTRSSSIDGNNVDDFRERVQRVQHHAEGS
jgi:hypothetical protein